VSHRLICHDFNASSVVVTGPLLSRVDASGVISPTSRYEPFGKGHNTLGLMPNTVVSLPVVIDDIWPSQCALTNESLFAVVCLDCNFTGVTSSIPEDDSAVFMQQSVLGHFVDSLSLQDEHVIRHGFRVVLCL
jgi:hypothetical protein